jgi:hypothetical protein
MGKVTDVGYLKQDDPIFSGGLKISMVRRLSESDKSSARSMAGRKVQEEVVSDALRFKEKGRQT